MELSEILSRICNIVAIVLTVSYFYQIVYMIVPIFFRLRRYEEKKLCRYAVLVAARNERNVLPYLIDSIKAQDYPRELIDVYVIADNCTDDTARLAAEHGATVYERFDTEHIGKGYALNFLLERIREEGKLDGYDAFLIFDADNLLRANYIREMNKICSNGYDAFCGYRNSKNFGDNWISAGYALWYLHDSTHLNRSRMILGNPAAVSGTGFGFTRELLERAGGKWNFFTLTEDIEFNSWCAPRGVKIGFAYNAELYDEQPSSFDVSWRQRTRWIQGGIQVTFKYFGTLLKGMFTPGRISWASFESFTLLAWGYALSFFTFILSFVAQFLSGGIISVVLSVAESFACGYGAMFVMGLLTTAMEWPHINTPAAKKIASLFTFPLFMMTYVPIAICSVFRPFTWKPIEHKTAMSIEEMTDTAEKTEIC